VIAGFPEREAELIELQHAYDLAVLEIGVYPLRPDFDLSAYEASIALGARLRARFVVAPIEDPDEERRADSLTRLAKLATAHGLRALVEFNPYSACRTLAEACALLDRAPGAEAGLCLDALHLFRSGGTVAQARAQAERIGLLHFCDATAEPTGLDAESLRRESRTARRLPGEGDLPLAELLDALPDAPISLEAPSPRLVGTAAARARIALDETARWLAAYEGMTPS
jgi:sugar phosphate isomerase/epimerase